MPKKNIQLDQKWILHVLLWQLLLLLGKLKPVFTSILIVCVFLLGNWDDCCWEISGTNDCCFLLFCCCVCVHPRTISYAFIWEIKTNLSPGMSVYLLRLSGRSNELIRELKHLWSSRLIDEWLNEWTNKQLNDTTALDKLNQNLRN